MKDQKDGGSSGSSFILHPSSFILPKITDFGLAKRLVGDSWQTQEGCVIGTPYITMLPASMAKGLASALPLAVHRPPFELPAITILQLWHARSDADPGSMLLRAIIRRVGKEARV